MKATRFDKCHLNFAIAFKAFNINIVINAVHTWMRTAFLLVPMNDFMWRSCLISRKKISTSHLLL